MRQLVTYLTAVLLTILLTGCPYGFKVPLGTAQRHDIDSRLTGYWVLDRAKAKEKPIILWVVPFNDSEYFAELTGSGGAPERFRAFPVEIGDQVFWNVSEVGASFPTASYMLGRSTLAPDGRLFLMFVGKSIPAALEYNAPGLRAYLESHLTDPSLDDDDGAYVWRRPKPGEIDNGRLRSWTVPSPR